MSACDRNSSCKLQNDLQIAIRQSGNCKEWFEVRPDGFDVYLYSAVQGSYTVRLEDVWERLPPSLRCHSYTVLVQGRKLEDVAPDARIFFDIDAGETVEIIARRSR